MSFNKLTNKYEHQELVGQTTAPWNNKYQLQSFLKQYRYFQH